MNYDEEYARYQRTVAPTLYPVTVDEAKTKLQIEDDDTQDVEVLDLIKQATARIEKDARWQFMTQTWKLNLDQFPCGEIKIRRCPVASITSVKYITGGVLTTWGNSNYQSDLVAAPARLAPVYGTVWPTVDYGVMNGIQITFVAGYASQALVPDDEKMVVLNVVKMLYYGCADSDAYWDLIRGMQRYGFIA